MMTWNIGRLGSRFNLLFEPYRRRVMHSALGRFLDEPMDLMIGLVDPDGTTRVLPFTADGSPLIGVEQRERLNSITYRGFSETTGLRLEFNVHSVFYPQVERLCLMPAFYLEARVNPAGPIRGRSAPSRPPARVRLVLRVRRPNTRIAAVADGPARIDLSYSAALSPRHEFDATPTPSDAPRTANVAERIVSLNDGCSVLPDGDGLSIELPVSAQGSGIKWRLVWAAHTSDPVLTVRHMGRTRDAVPRYAASWGSLDEVIQEAISTRDERLALSRRFERMIDQSPLDTAQEHLLYQAFQNWLGNTFWCDVRLDDGRSRQWFSTWDGTNLLHSPLAVEYNLAPLYLTLWPRLLRMQFPQWAEHERAHEASGGGTLPHDLGRGCQAIGAPPAPGPQLEENCDFLLMLQAYAHWTGDRKPAENLAPVIERLARYILWTDRDRSGFPSKGTLNTFRDAQPAMSTARKQTYLAVKRLGALRAAADLLQLAGHSDAAARLEATADADLDKIEQSAWLGDHYAVCVDHSAAGLTDPRTGRPLPYEQLLGWDSYCLHTPNALLLPTLVGRPPLLSLDRVKKDIIAAARENQSRYGCGHTSSDAENVWVSQNIWRDTLARYLKLTGPVSAQDYWDLQVLNNTHDQSLGFADTYINNIRAFHPRGITAIGYLLAGPRLVIDRLAPGGRLISVDPDRHGPRRWPLLALADWKVGRIPICVIDETGHVSIEGQTDPVIIHRNAGLDESISGVEFIG